MKKKLLVQNIRLGIYARQSHEKENSASIETQIQLGEEKAKRIEQHLAQMIQKFEKAIDRLNELSAKIEDRAAKAATGGHDVAAVRTNLDLAKAKIAEAEQALNDAKAKYDAATKEADFRVAFERVKKLVSGVEEKIRVAHDALAHVIASVNPTDHTVTTPPAPASTPAGSTSQ